MKHHTHQHCTICRPSFQQSSYVQPFHILSSYEANNCRGEELLITTPESAVPCYVVPTDEEIMIARDTFNLCK